MFTIKDHVKGEVTFLEYRQGNLWYKTETEFEFPVPVDDCGDATFKNKDKAILFMRYIRRHMQNIKDKEDYQRVFGGGKDTPLIETCQMK